MICDYGSYFKADFIVPTAELCFCLIILAISAKPLIKTIKKAKAEKKIDATEVFKMLFLFGIVGFFSITSILTLKNGGIHLISEKESDAVVSYGVIEKIHDCEPEFSRRYHVNSTTTFGAHITIDGHRYYAMGSGNFQVGDYVEFEYLPKSEFILLMIKRQS